MSSIFKLVVFSALSLFTLTAFSANTKKTIITFVKEAGGFHQLEDILLAQGFTHSQATELLKNELVPPKWHLNPKDKFLVIKNLALGRTDVKFYLDYFEDTLTFWKTKKEDGLEKKHADYQIKPKTVEGPILGSLSESIKHKINDEWVVERFTDAFIWDLNLSKKLKQKDHFKFTIEQKFDEGHFVKNGEIIEAELTTKDKTLKRLLLVKENRKVFIDPDKTFDDRLFYAPVDYVHISSPFSLHRLHPLKHTMRPHEGIDFALPEGSVVYAPRDGVVTDISKRHGNGRYITLSHEDGLVTFYNHLKAPKEGLVIGQKVSAGDIIAYVGCTGFCTSPHLHFAIKKGNRMIDPTYLLKPYPYFAKDYTTLVSKADH